MNCLVQKYLSIYCISAWDLIHDNKTENIELLEKYSILKQTDMPPGILKSYDVTSLNKKIFYNNENCDKMENKKCDIRKIFLVFAKINSIILFVRVPLNKTLTEALQWHAYGASVHY